MTDYSIIYIHNTVELRMMMEGNNGQHLFQFDKLLERINEKRNELLCLTEKNGLKNKKVLECSQELDKLIYKMQIIKKQIANRDSHSLCEEET